jgi:predicted MFS family arabinose efflux permease
LGGWLCDRLWKRIGPRRACSLLGAAGVGLSGVLLYAAARAPHPIAAVVLLSLCLGAEQFTDAIYWAAAITLAGRDASAACGLMNTGGNLSGGLAALLVPVLVDWLGWPAALTSGSLFAFAAAGLWLVTVVERPEARTGAVPAAAAV